MEAADKVREAVEEVRVENEHFRRRAAVAIGVLAMLLAIAGLAGDKASRDMVNSNILASDTWAFFQAKNIRQASYQLAADQRGGPPGSRRARPAGTGGPPKRRIAPYRAPAARKEGDPDPAN